MSKALAICGGEKTIEENRKYDIRRDLFTEDDRKAIIDYVSKKDSLISYYGDEGLQKEYENALAEYLGKKYCILFNSGTNAILAAYFALSLEPGDEVLVPDCSFFAVATPLLLLGIDPVVVDCDASLGLMDPEDLKKKITEKSKAVIVNHLCGHPVEMQAIMKLCQENNLKLIEDLSLAIGATYNDTLVGTMGDISCLSLGSTKLLSGGQGGAFLTDNTEYYERAILLGCFGKRAYQNILNPFYRQFAGGSYGTNSRMHPLAIAMSYARFCRRNELIEMRHERYNMISSALRNTGIIEPPITKKNVFRGSWHGYYATYDEENYDVPIEVVVCALQKEGLEVYHRAHYPMLHELQMFRKRKDGRYGIKENPYHMVICEETEYANTIRYNNKVISFPLFLDEPIELIQKYCDAIYKVTENFTDLKGIQL